MKIFLVDATYELFRSYFGAPSRENSEGQEIGAVYGMVRSLFSLLNHPDVTHLACAFDHVVESFRNDLYSGYKTSDGIVADLLAQFPVAEQACRLAGIVTWPMVEFEADDALATAALKYSEHFDVEQVVICSPDKDFAQCVRGDRVVCLDRRREKWLNEAGVYEKFGIAPLSIPDWLALVGDSADGFPGIPGWGAKSASLVLAHYRSLEKIPLKPEELEVPLRGADRLIKNLVDRFNDALLFRRLARLREDVPLEESLDDLKWSSPGNKDVRELGFLIGDTKAAELVPE